MESWVLVLNRIEGESYAYRFAEEPVRDDDDTFMLVEYSGEGLKVHNNLGNHKIRKITNTGKLTVVLRIERMDNWYVKRDDLDYEPEEG